MTTFVTVIHIIVCLFLILVILLQAGKGGGMGAAFGGGGSQTVFGGRGAATFLSKLTAVMAFLFMFTSIFLAYKASQQEDKILKGRSDQATKKKKEAEEKARKALKTGLGGAATKIEVKVPPKSVPQKPSAKPEEPGKETSSPEGAAPKAEPKAKTEPKVAAPKAEPKAKTEPKVAAPKAAPAPKAAAPKAAEPKAEPKAKAKQDQEEKSADEE